ncbi:MAG TPA: sigma factor-like helix-turn-helix DNA-binding protein, partial [Mycobacterium sp.]|nr:sigma factor-like helix-turn-helix DNA-binding protein [Mycobacterium sp.]
ESYLRLAGTDLSEINDVRAWLTVVAGRLCLDRVRSARARREQPGLPLGDDALNQLRGIDPADRVTLDEQVSDALLLVLHRLGPGERVAFVLHDIFEIPFDEVARTVGRPVGTCRQLASRARAKIHAARPRVLDVSTHEHQVVIDKFIAACATGDIGALAAVLDPDVWGVGTLLAQPAPPVVINFGPTAVATNLLRYLGPGVTLVGGPVGEPVLFAYAQRRLFAVIALTFRYHRIVKIEATADPAARRLG